MKRLVQEQPGTTAGPLHPGHLPGPRQEPQGLWEPEAALQVQGRRAGPEGPGQRITKPSPRSGLTNIGFSTAKFLAPGRVGCCLGGGGGSKTAPLPRNAAPTAERATRVYDGHRRPGSRERAGRGPPPSWAQAPRLWRDRGAAIESPSISARPAAGGHSCRVPSEECEPGFPGVEGF